jgi:hypothetical protein
VRRLLRNGAGGGDIIRPMNRLSSAVYVMMCRLKSGAFYGNGGR